MIGWGRHHADRAFHAITSENDHGSVTTSCNGRWSASEEHVIIRVDANGNPEHPLDAEKVCGACFDKAIAKMLEPNGYFATIDLRSNVLAEFAVDMGEITPSFTLDEIHAAIAHDADLDPWFDFGGEA